MLARVGGYRNAVVLAIIVWVAGLIFLLFRRSGNADKSNEDAGTATLSEIDHIRRLIDEAVDSGKLSEAQKAELDMRVLNFWRARKNLQDVSVATGLATLKDDKEAGPLLRGLEQWLYSRTNPTHDEVLELLKPLAAISTADDGASQTPTGTPNEH